MGRSRSPDRKDRKRSRSPDRDARKRSRSRSRDRKRERSPDRKRERKDRSRSRERKRERSPDRRKHRSRSRSADRSRKDKDKDKHKDRDRDRDRGRDADRGRDRDRDREKDKGKVQLTHAEPEEEEEGAQPVATKKAEPISLEELLKKRQEEAAREAKPVFMTKAQREAAAIAAREAQVKAQREAMESQRQQAQTSRNAQVEMERQQREQARQARLDEREREKELEGIKLQYLGEKKQKKRIVRPSEKFRFNFDWENTEDTSKDLNPLYNNPHEAALLFGRGLRAGIDFKEQKKHAATHENEVRSAMKKAAGVETTREDREAERRLVKAAEKYEDTKMKKDTHWSSKALEAMTERDWRIFKEDFNISIKGGKIPNPCRNWEECQLPKQLIKAVDKAGYKKPSPIQMAAIPLGMKQRDVIGVAETGSGKTCAFVLPMLVYCMKLPPMTEELEAEGPYAVVMAPTRELAQQIEEETVKFAYYLDYRVVSVVGGQNIEEQGFKLRRGCELVIATPGRLLDCLQSRYTVLNQCNYIVLDEADRMIDLGFEPQVMGVMDQMPSSNLKPTNDDEELDLKKIYRTTYMFSATMPPAVERLARKYMRNPAVINIGNAGKSADLIRQDVFMMKENEKLHALEDLVTREIFGDRTAIVFVNAKKQCDYVAKQLESMNCTPTVLHGGKTQDQREASLEGFKSGKFNVLVATDVAGRGIDVPDVAHVVNFAMPNQIEQYTHRIGRTGRAGKSGVATTFITEQDSEIFYDFKQYLQNAKANIPPELARHEASKVKPGLGDKKRRQDDIIFQ